MNRKILHYLRKKKKHISMLDNHINYTFIHNLHLFDVLLYINICICKHHLKRPKTSKRDSLLGLTGTLSLYIRTAKFDLLAYYFSFGSN